jgi:hypothetical protein
VSALVATSSGNIFVADYTPALQIRVFDSNGRFIGNAGRSGGGPGEYRLVGAMQRGPRGIHVMDPFGARVLIFGDRGELV